MAFRWLSYMRGGASGSSTDKVVSVTYPSGAVIGYGYDGVGRVQSITANGTSVLANVTYNADNRVSGWTWANGLAVSRTYDAYGRLSSFPLGNPVGAGIAAGVTRTLAYDNAGRIVAFTHSSGVGNQTMGYDGLDRLTSHVTPTKSVAYTYDATGNRTSMTIGSLVYTNTVSATSNRFLSIQLPSGGGTQSHDAAGNLVEDGATSYTYSDRGRQISATAAGATTNYRYNALEQRVSKTGPVARYYAYDDSGMNVGAYDSSMNVAYETVYLGSTPVAILMQVGARSGADSPRLRLTTPMPIRSILYVSSHEEATKQSYGGGTLRRPSVMTCLSKILQGSVLWCLISGCQDRYSTERRETFRTSIGTTVLRSEHMPSPIPSGWRGASIHTCMHPRIH